MLSLEGRELGGCKLIRKIGEGGMGEVYLAEQRRMGNRMVAVKVVQPDELSFPSRDAADVAKQFAREAALLGQFSHPNILPVHDSGVAGDLLFLIMQYAPEGSLADAMRGRAARPLALPAPVPFVADLVGQIASALQYTHDRGVIHRDVKPGNVLIRIEPDGRWHALLADFGVARAENTTSQRTQVTGTFAYMAPEQFSGKFSPASDQYALAVVAYQLLTGRAPFEGDLASITRGHMFDPPPPPRSINPAVPTAVEQVVLRALAKDPAQRYPSVSAFADALRAAAAGSERQIAAEPTVVAPPPILPAPQVSSPSPPTPTPVPAPSPATPRPRLWRTWMLALAALVLLAGVIGASGLVLRQQQEQQAAAATATAGAATARAASETSTQAAGATATATGTASTATSTTTATPGVSSDVTQPLAPPVPVGAAVFQDPAPTCDQPQTISWTRDTGTQRACQGTSAVQISATTPNVLSCLENQSAQLGDGYFDTIVSPGSSDAVLAFREAAGQQNGSNFAVEGYFYKVDPTHQQITLYKTGADGTSSTLGTYSLPGALAASFDLGVSVQGGTITMYINNQPVAAHDDSTYTTGWVGICTDGQATYSNARLYNAAK